MEPGYADTLSFLMTSHNVEVRPYAAGRTTSEEKEVVDVFTLADRDIFEELGLTKKSPFATDQ